MYAFGETHGSQGTGRDGRLGAEGRARPVHGLVSPGSGLLPGQPNEDILVRCGLDLHGLLLG